MIYKNFIFVIFIFFLFLPYANLFGLDITDEVDSIIWQQEELIHEIDVFINKLYLELDVIMELSKKLIQEFQEIPDLTPKLRTIQEIQGETQALYLELLDLHEAFQYYLFDLINNEPTLETYQEDMFVLQAMLTLLHDIQDIVCWLNEMIVDYYEL